MTIPDLIRTSNAIIKNTSLGMDDHSMFTCMLMCEGDGWGQGFGGYRLDSRLEDPPSKYGIEFIKKIIETVGCGSWEKLSGQHLRIKHTHDKIYAIGHILEERWFDPTELLELLREKE